MATSTGLIWTLLLYAVCCTVADKCSLDGVEYMTNFEEKKYLGLWYEMRWYASKRWTAADVNVDYSHYYYKKAGSDALHYDKYYRSGRTGKCDKIEASQQPTGNAGKYMNGDKIFYIAITDYNNYALDFTCEERVNGTCVDSSANVWSRKQTISEEHMRIVESTIAKLCVNETRYYPIPHKEDCRSTGGAGVAAASLGLLVLTATWRLMESLL